MRVFVTGASGHLGSAVVPALRAAGHQIVGLARSDAAAAALQARGVEVVRGSLTDLELLAAAAAAADGVVHLAYDHEAMVSGDITGAAATDLRVAEAIGDALAGSGKPFTAASGTLLLASLGLNRPGLETDVAAESSPRVATENLIIGLAERGVRSSMVRLPPIVHSHLDHHGFAHVLIGIARRTGVAGYLGDGANRWPACHTLDAAELFRLAVESAPAGTRLHAVGDEGIPFREIAETIGRRLGLPAAPIEPDQAAEHFGFLSFIAGADNPTDNSLTREAMSWKPTHPGLLEDLEEGHYFDVA
ncbi:SDR family oxidoreductase [Nocardia niigatensis]